MIDKNFLSRKVKLIQEDLAALKPLGRFNFDELARHQVYYNAAERLLERIITRAIDINRHCLAEMGKGSESVKTYTDTFLRLADIKIYPKSFAEKIAPSAGLRNVLVHEYDEIDKKLVFQSLHQALSQYAKYCEYILRLIRK